MSDDEGPKQVTITREEMQQAIVYFAARKSGTPYPLKHTITLNGSLVLMGGDGTDNFCTVTIEHLANVTPIRRKP